LSYSDYHTPGKDRCEAVRANDHEDDEIMKAKQRQAKTLAL